MSQFARSPHHRGSERLREVIAWEHEGVALSGWRWPARDRRAPRMVALHGFLGSGLDFQALADHVAGEVDLVAPDLVGHGSSDAPAQVHAYTMESAVAQLQALDAVLPPRRPTILVGYSMGGRLAAHLALADPGAWDALVLVSTNPGLGREPDRRARVAHDERWVEMIQQHGVSPFLEAWYRQELIATQSRIAKRYLEPMRARRALLRAEGLVGSLRGMGTGRMEPLWGHLHRVEMPVLLVTGEDDSKYMRLAFYTQLGLPLSWHRSIRHAGHSVHLEAPVQFARILRGWLRRRRLLLD